MNVRDMLVSHHALHSALSSSGGLESAAPAGGIDRTTEAIQKELGSAGVRGHGPGAVSALSEALTMLDDAKRDPGIMTAVDQSTASLLQSYLAERAAEKKSATPAPAGGLEAKFDDNDILGWVGSFFTWWRGIRKHDWLPPPSEPEEFSTSLRVAVLGDWGTGLYGAPVCSDSIQKDSKPYGLLLHLGDVYYSGTEKEVAERFLALWPNLPGARSRSLEFQPRDVHRRARLFQSNAPPVRTDVELFRLAKRPLVAGWPRLGLSGVRSGQGPGRVA